MMPPPRTSMRLGMKLSSRAEVESQMRGSEGMNPGASGSEPAAMIALLKRTTRAPSAVSTRNVKGEVNCPSPIATLTLRCLARPVRPVVSRFTTPSFHPRMAVRSKAGAPKLTPWLANAAASSMTLATCRSALDGMQPTLRHTPPRVGGEESGGIAAGTGAENQYVGLEVGNDGGRGPRDCSGRRSRRPLRVCAAGIGRQQRALAHLVADLDVDLADHPILRRRHVHRRLVAFERQDRRVLLHALPRRDKDFDDRHVLEVADVGKPDFVGHGRHSPLSGRG